MIIEIPEEHEDKNILIQANGELIMFKLPSDDKFTVKIRSCSNCGQCCLDIGESGPYGCDDEGKCLRVIKDGDNWYCSTFNQLRGPQPFRCVFDPNKFNAFGCTIKYADVSG